MDEESIALKAELECVFSLLNGRGSYSPVTTVPQARL